MGCIYDHDIKGNTKWESRNNPDVIERKVLDDIKAEIEADKRKAVDFALSTTDLTERYAHLRMETAYAIALAVIDKHLGEDGDTE